MATAEQLKSLVRSHFRDDYERFVSLSLQMAAHEAKQGHGALAHDLRQIIDKAWRERSPVLTMKFPKELGGLVFSEQPETPLAALVLPDSLRLRIERIVQEYHQREKLKTHALMHRRKLLLVGPPGTGKTMTSRVLAHELRMPLHTIQVDKLVTKFMGETSAKLRQIFDLIAQQEGVYLFDEFDAIGGERSRDNDVGEMRRVLNAFLQFIEQDASDSLIIGATNTPQLLDRALFRRFDDVLYYTGPDEEERQQLIRNVLGSFLDAKFSWKNVLEESRELSHAEIDHACRDAIKQAILSDRSRVNATLLRQMIGERLEASRGQE